MTELEELTELENWKQYIKLEEYEKILEFIEQTKNCQKLINKFLFISGNIQKAIKLVIDIENAIGIDECDYIEYSNLDDIFVPNNNKYILQPNYANTKCLTIELNDNQQNNDFYVIKEICSQNNLNFNTIIISNNAFIDLSMMVRAIVINM